jgi:hypothetical protein
MAFLTVKRSFLTASCWSFEVMKGGTGYRRLEVGGHRPVFLGHEGLDLALAVADELHGHGLNAARGEAAADLLPQDGAHAVAHQAVEDAPGLLRVHLLLVDVLRLLEGLLDGALRDLVEDHAAEALLAPHSQGFGEVPADGLALPVGIGGQVDRLRLLGGRAQLVQHLALGGEDGVLDREASLGVDAADDVGGVLRALGVLGQVPDVAHGGHDAEVAAEVLVYGLRLGGRLDDDEVLGQRAPFARLSRRGPRVAGAPCPRAPVR